MGRCVRLPGWEQRLAAVLESAGAKPYVLGEHDCVTVACAAVQALTGRELWGQWRGKYSNRREALQLCVEFGGSFTGAISRLFGAAPVAWKLARRGDVAEYRQALGAEVFEPHLCVVAGGYGVGLGPRGTLRVALSDCAHAWRID